MTRPLRRWGAPLGAVVITLVVTAVTWAWGLGLEFDSVASGSGESLRELREIEVGGSISVGSDSDGRWLLAAGFQEPEADGAWISSLRARLAFEVAPGNASDRVVVTVVPLLAPSLPIRPITVSSSIDAASVDLTGGAQEISVVIDGQSRQEITIDCVSVDSPLDLGVGPDKRELCAKVVSLRLAKIDG